jgi:predicted nucleic acid-binding protein
LEGKVLAAVDFRKLSGAGSASLGAIKDEVCYRKHPVRRRRGRELDLAIAACALVRDAELWTLNVSDFQDVPGLRAFSPV